MGNRDNEKWDRWFWSKSRKNKGLRFGIQDRICVHFVSVFYLLQTTINGTLMLSLCYFVLS